jgi:hypothetical protein
MQLPSAVSGFITAILSTFLQHRPIVEFTSADVVRSGLCAMWVRAFEEEAAPALAQ